MSKNISLFLILKIYWKTESFVEAQCIKGM